MIRSENGKKTGKKNLLAYLNSEAGKKQLQSIGRKTGRANLLNWYKLNPEKHKETSRKNLIKAQIQRVSKSQKRLSDELFNNNIENRLEWYVPNVRRIIDIAILKSKIAIEVDGSSHTKPIFGTLKQKQADDELKNKQLESLGWKVLRFTDNEINSNVARVVERIKGDL